MRKAGHARPARDERIANLEERDRHRPGTRLDAILGMTVFLNAERIAG